ncbi:STAS domain-containing protein [Streptomyces sp. NPDC047123]|uniref:STAS domain-containing protein n=1 Tax=unclassified Streptomyces TaxID=2593676 RepID=UPI0033CA02A5
MTERPESSVSTRHDTAADLSVTHRGPVPVVAAAGSLDADNVDELQTALADACASGAAADPSAPFGPRVRTVLDLSGLHFADSSVLHVLLESQRQHRATGKQLVVCGPFRPVVHRLFDVTGTAEFFDLSEDLETALSAAR